MTLLQIGGDTQVTFDTSVTVSEHDSNCVTDLFISSAGISANNNAIDYASDSRV